MKILLLLAVFVPTHFIWCPAGWADSTKQKLSIETLDDRLIVRFGESEIAHYVFQDPEVPRPYFAHVKTPLGTQATRNYPPVEGQDKTDHKTIHPGLWMAFGDLDGEDFWRNKASIQHVKFIETPQASDNTASFVEEKRYLASNGTEVCREIFHWTMYSLDDGFLMEWNSLFSSQHEFYFGDQEEMGLGVRVATPVAEKNGGLLRDSEGRKRAKRIWSNAASWCDYRGTIDEQTVGVSLLCHPENFRPSWMHARDYGFMAANPFGRKAMHKGEESKIIVKPGESLHLRFGVWIYETEPDAEIDIEAAYRKYVELCD